MSLQFGKGEISESDFEKARQTILDRVARRASKPDTYKNICRRIDEISGEAATILKSMLTFEESDRPSARDCADQWGQLARDLGGAAAAQPTTTSGKWDDVANDLEAIQAKQLTVTRKQIERIAAETREAKRASSGSELETLIHIETLIKKIKTTELVGLM